MEYIQSERPKGASDVLSKEAFLQQFILTRTSHKRDFEDLMKDALDAYEFCRVNSRVNS